MAYIEFDGLWHETTDGQWAYSENAYKTKCCDQWRGIPIGAEVNEKPTEKLCPTCFGEAATK